MFERFPQLFFGMIALSVALVLSSITGALLLRDLRRTNDQVEVTGSARMPIRSDFIIWRGSVASQQPTLPQAYQEVALHTERIRSFLRERQIPDSVVVFRSIETYPVPEVAENGRETGRVLGYRLTQWFEVRSSEVQGIARLAQDANGLINEGVPLMASSPEYLFTRLADVRVQMLSEATQDARARADAIARSAGGEIGAVRSVRMGVFQITPRHSTEVSDYGINDTSSLEKDITAVVRVTFAVD